MHVGGRGGTARQDAGGAVRVAPLRRPARAWMGGVAWLPDAARPSKLKPCSRVGVPVFHDDAGR